MSFSSMSIFLFGSFRLSFYFHNQDYEIRPQAGTIRDYVLWGTDLTSECAHDGRGFPPNPANSCFNI